MDFTRYGVEKREDELSVSYERLKKRVRVMALRAALFVFFAALFGGCAFLYGAWRGIVDKTPDVDSISISPSGFATYIYDSAGHQLQKLTTPDSNRTAVSLDRVPADLQNAFIAIEDERFYLHKGVDPKGLIRALVTAASHGFRTTQGASTITQQLLKNNVFTTWTEEKTLLDKIERKIEEQYLAVKLEEKLGNKALILENYLNTVNLGAGTYGVEAASRKYFNKDVWELTLSEATVIAGITQNPSRFNPIRHPDENAGRRQRVLGKMLELGYITEAQKEEALADDVYARIEEAQKVQAQTNTVYTYFIDELTTQVVRDLIAQKGYSEVAAWQLLYSGGLKIYTTQDPAIQAVCDEEYANPENFPEGTMYYLDWAMTVRHADGESESFSREMLKNDMKANQPADSAEPFDLLFMSEAEAQSCVDAYKSRVLREGDEITAERTEFIPQPQSSLVVMDQRTGYVKAVVGGRGKKTASRVLNRAAGSFRQPGSTFKILSTYAAALDSGAKTIGSFVEDAPYTYENGGDVHNADETYRGWITLREAIVHSVNVAAVKVLTQITPLRGYQQLLKFGITSLNADKDVVQPLALGGISKGVSNLELTAAYASLANGGIWTKPVFYTRILNEDGTVLIDNTPETRRAVSADTAFILTDAMEGVVREGTGTALALESGMPVAGKTGTTSAYNDLWFVGYTPYLTMGIWAGYDNNRKLPEEGIYREYHKILWKKIMTRLTEGQAVVPFTRPASVMTARTCGLTNLLPSEGCEHIADDFISSAFYPARVCSLCGSGEAESFNESDWQVFTEETIEENAYEPITEAELSDWLETPAGGTEDGQAFDIVTEDAGTFFEEEEDDYYDDVEDVYLFDDEENEVTVIE